MFKISPEINFQTNFSAKYKNYLKDVKITFDKPLHQNRPRQKRLTNLFKFKENKKNHTSLSCFILLIKILSSFSIFLIAFCMSISSWVSCSFSDWSEFAVRVSNDSMSDELDTAELSLKLLDKSFFEFVPIWLRIFTASKFETGNTVPFSHSSNWVVPFLSKIGFLKSFSESWL